MKHIMIKTVSLLILILCVFTFECNSKNVEIYVSAKGNNANSGMKNSPVKTLEKAKDLILKSRQQEKESKITVFIEDGIYPLDKPFVLTSKESGTEKYPVVIKASGEAKPVFTGSRELKKWQVLKDQAKLKKLSVGAKSKVYVTELKDAGITDLGNPIEPGKRPELFCNGDLQTLARWPNSDFAKAGLVKGQTQLPPTFKNRKGTKEGIFEYSDNRQNRWADEKEVYLGGYWFWDWADEFQKVSKIDTLLKTLYLAEPYHRYGYKDSLRYFGVNLFCEIDEPGEWYLDRTDGQLYWYPPVGVNPEKAQVTLSVFNAPFMVELKNCSNVTLQGLTFQESRGSAVSIADGKNCQIKDCRFQRFGRDGIHIAEGSGHGISGCLIRTLGFRGIEMKGGDRKNLVAANHFIENTVVEHFSLFKRTYEPAVYLDGCGMRVANNRFRYSSSSAMRLEGNDFTIEYNEVSHVVNESDDQGALDMWYNPSYRGVVVRYNHWSDITGGTHSGAAGVRLDDMISGVLIYGNIFERVGSAMFGGVQIHGGKDNLVENNLFFECLAAVTFHRWGEERWHKELDTLAIRKKIFEEVDILSPQYQSKYPELKTIRENADVNTVKNNLIVDCKNQFLRNKMGVQILINNPVLQSDGKTADAFCAPEILDKYGLQPIPYQQIGPKNNPWIN
ncbi:MAG: right-handed parallel beta-helix repeat-containing protein [Prolixibacteraceae bacterium]|nr:right-handed parallel beta-helix repeat-containing protein [Prolixibacteraceae bacterium]